MCGAFPLAHRDREAKAHSFAIHSSDFFLSLTSRRSSDSCFVRGTAVIADGCKGTVGGCCAIAAVCVCDCVSVTAAAACVGVSVAAVNSDEGAGAAGL